VRYQRRPGNSFDRQYERFQVPFGAFRGAVDREFDFRVRLSRLIVDYQIALLENQRTAAEQPTPETVPRRVV